MLAAATERIVRHLEALPAAPASVDVPLSTIDPILTAGLPETGERLEDLLDLIFDRFVPQGVDTASPGCLSYINSGGIFHAALADLITATTNRYVAYRAAAPALADLEAQVIRWFCDLAGLPPSSGGVLLSGGSMASLTAIVTARRERLGSRFDTATIYASDQMHHSILKSAMIAGLSLDNVRAIPTDETFRMRADELEAAITRDKAQGLTPFFVAGTAGTTNTGAIDDLEAVAAIARRHHLWFHVDGSYGGLFLLTGRGRGALKGIEHADTIALDPHKTLFIPYGSGCLLARDVKAMLRAHTIHSEYIATIAATGDSAPNFADLSVEQTREGRGLRIWLPLKLLGAGTFREALDEKLDLARSITNALEAIPTIEIVARPQLSIVAFRASPAGATDERADALNEAILTAVNRRGRVHLSGTTLRGRFAIRVCVLSFRAHEARIEACIEDIRAAVDEVLGAGG